MRPILAIFKKELRQHGSLAAGMVVLCLLFQTAYFLLYYDWYLRGSSYYSTGDHEFFFALAVLTTLLYAGAAAALAYSTEVAEKTFNFLRRLPIAPQTLALGKAAWVLCGTILVLLANLQLAAVWVAIVGYTAIWNLPDAYKIWLTYGIGIFEVIIWGFFWSTRCRSQFHALLATYLSAAISLYFITYFFATSVDVIDMYIDVIPYRLAVALLVAIPAVWGMLRWFTYEWKCPVIFRFLPDNLLLIRYPQKVQHPFLALIHQHVRHASLLYHFGILCFFAWSLGWVFLGLLERESLPLGHMLEALFGFGFFICLVGMVLFWGTLFGHDQRNDSYHFLTRLGVSYRKIWWSRTLLPILLYLPALLCVFAATALQVEVNELLSLPDWQMLLFFGSLALTIWLTPAAMGSFFSISLRNQMLTIALTGAGTIGFYIAMLFFHSFTGHSPHWTTLPMCIAVLVASRLRTKYWIRETYTWRSRLIPLLPLFGVMLAVVIAHPFVRIYSVPYISWSQIEAFLDQADIPERMPPEKRAALIQYANSRHPFPPEYRDFFTRIEGDPGIIENYTYEEYLLLYYAYSRYEMEERRYPYHVGIITSTLRASPWESARRNRLLRFQIVRLLVESGRLQNESAKSLTEELDYFWLVSTLDGNARQHLLWYDSPESRLREDRLDMLWKAMEKWYAAHQTLPESLDDLVADGFLETLPMKPFTTEVMVEYHFNAPPPDDIDRLGISVRVLQEDRSTAVRYRSDSYQLARESFRESGGTYLRYDNVIYVVIGEFPAEE